MTVAASSPVLLVNREKPGLIPLSRRGLTVSQSSVASLNRKYTGALLIFDDGSKRKIERVVKLGVYGASLSRRLLSALTGVISIRVDLGDAEPMSLPDFKTLIVELIQKDAALEEPAFPHNRSIDETIRDVEVAENFEAVFRAIEMPADEDCLDAL